MAILKNSARILMLLDEGNVKLFLVKSPSLARHKEGAYMSSLKSSKEGDLPLFILPKREIWRETIPRH